MLLFIDIHITALLCFIGLLAFDDNDCDQLKAANTSMERRAFLKRWVLSSWLTFAAAGILLLLMTGNLPFLIAPVVRLGFPVHRRYTAILFIAGLIVAMPIASIYQLKNLRKMDDRRLDLVLKQTCAGYLSALIPRDTQERKLAWSLALSAGIGEEIVFRVLLPAVLLYLTKGRFATAVLIAAVIVFGLSHAYQGIFGMLTATFLGSGFMLAYLVTVNIFASMILHFLIDARGLVLMSFLRPAAIQEHSRRHAEPPPDTGFAGSAGSE